MRINDLDPTEAARALRDICGSPAWVEAMLARRPFSDLEALKRAATSCWQALPRAEWLRAFAHHPRIGESQLRAKFSRQEQSGVEGASEATLQALARGNLAYEAKFGHVFLICATGKSAADMLTALERRIELSAEEEIHNAALEQEKIVHIRLERWSNESA